ncbi:hypothetical protein B0H13DRAFT_2398934 [Mycena leptocephala]|nr:hypothetical protein B0H13DRAFT_2398934 [Mycena leptocephala]
MAITRFTSARSSSPTRSENTDMYYEEFDHATPSPAPSQNADAYSWESDDAPMATDPRDITPYGPDRPHLHSRVGVTKTSAVKAVKAKKGKEKAKPAEAAAAEPVVHTRDDDDPFLAADLARATAASLGQQTEHDNATADASSSRRLATAPGSPPKHQRANTAGDASATASAPAVGPTTAGAPNVPTFAQVAAPAVVSAAAPNVPALCAVINNPSPMWLTADGLPPRGSFTPTPAGGFASIIYEPLQLFVGVPPELIQMYKGVPAPKVFMTVSGGNGAIMRTHGHIRAAIGDFVNVDPTSFTLSTSPTAANGTSSALWLLAGLPGPLTQTILDNRVLSTTAITLYPLPYELPIIGFVGMFAGFTLPNSNNGVNTVHDLIRTALQDNSEIREFVHTHRSAYGPVTANKAWEILLASIVVHGINLLVQDTHTWGQFRRLFGKLQILTLHGTARLQRPFRCQICPSVDHPTPLCPFPHTPGWLGPTHATIAVVLDAGRTAAAKAQEMMHPANFDAGTSNSRGGNGRQSQRPWSKGPPRWRRKKRRRPQRQGPPA